MAACSHSGANIINMALAGVLAGYLPFYLWGGGRARRLAIFAGGALSVLVSAVLALSELLALQGADAALRVRAFRW